MLELVAREVEKWFEAANPSPPELLYWISTLAFQPAPRQLVPNQIFWCIVMDLHSLMSHTESVIPRIVINIQIVAATSFLWLHSLGIPVSLSGWGQGPSYGSADTSIISYTFASIFPRIILTQTHQELSGMPQHSIMLIKLDMNRQTYVTHILDVSRICVCYQENANTIHVCYKLIDGTGACGRNLFCSLYSNVWGIVSACPYLAKMPRYLKTNLYK